MICARRWLIHVKFRFFRYFHLRYISLIFVHIYVHLRSLNFTFIYKAFDQLTPQEKSLYEAIPEPGATPVDSASFAVMMA